MAGTIYLSLPLIQSLRTISENSYPEECCGFMAGCLIDSRSKTVYNIRQSKNMNYQRSSERYEINPVEFLKFEKECSAKGEEILGFFHSHPDHPAVPSEYDGKMAWPGYCYLIISVMQGKVKEMRCWSLEGEDGEFQEEIIRGRS